MADTRSFAGRGMTLQQLNQATQTQQAAKRAAIQVTVQDDTSSTAASTAQQAVTVAAQQQSSAAAASASSQQAASSTKQAASLPFSTGRSSRSVSDAPKVGDTVTVNGKQYTFMSSDPSKAGMTLDEYHASTAADRNAKAAAAEAALSTSSMNTDLIGGETTISSSSYYDVDSALNSIYNQAKAAGISVTKPTSYGQSITDATKAQKIIDDYVANANSIAAKSAGASISSTKATSGAAVYDISSNIAEVKAAVKDYNLGVAAPKTTQYKSQAEAQAALNSYIDSTQRALDSYNQSQAASQKVTVYDDLGRKQEITQSQLSQMQKAASNQTWRENYTVLPEEVANSNANWWINSNGLYEWTPVTAGDKAHLAEENKQREQFHQTPKTTLTAGASPSQAYSDQWYSTGGNRTSDGGGSGSAKLAKLRASSTVNASATAKSNTAQQQKPTVWSAEKTQAAKIETAKSTLAPSTTKSSPWATTPTIQEQMAKNATVKQNTGKLTITPAAKTTNGSVNASTLSAPWSASYTQGTKNTLTTYTATDAEKAALNKQYEQAKAANYDTSVVKASRGNQSSNYKAALETAKQAAAKTAAQRANFAEVRDNKGNIIDAIQQKGSGGTGESGVTIYTKDATTGEIASQSGTVKEYAQAINAAQKLANTELSSFMSTEQQREILAARKYLTDRGLTTQSKTETMVAKQVEDVGTWLTAHSVEGSQAARVGTGLKNLTKGDFSDNVASGLVSYIELAEKGDDIFAATLKPAFTAAEKAKQAIWTNTLANTSISLDEKGRIYIDQKGSESKNAKVTFNAKEEQDRAIQGNVVLRGAHQFVADTYNDAKESPVKFGATVLALRGIGAAYGAGTRGLTTLTRSGLVGTGEKVAVWSTKAAETHVVGKVTSKALSGASRVAIGTSRVVEPATNTYFAAEIGKDIYTSAKSNNYNDVFGTVATLAVGAGGFKKGNDWVGSKKTTKVMDAKLQDYPSYKISDISPKIAEAKISEMAGSGASTKPVDLSYGHTLAIGNKPIVSHISGEGVSGLRMGSAAAPESAITGKVTQAFSKLETEFFKQTVTERGGQTEADYLNSALNIAKQVSKQRKPLYTPETFEITSTAIPKAARAPITEAIKSYQGDVVVTGSVPMKAQAGGFVSRKTHDLELYADDAAAVVARINTGLKKSGLKEGVDYQIKGSKVLFKTNDGWDIGIDAFTHKAEPATTTKTTTGESPAPVVTKGKSEIAFGYESRSPILVGSKQEGFIKTQNIAEQLTRKVAGSTFLHSSEIVEGRKTAFDDNTLGPAHINRFKDIADTVTTATAFAVNGKLPIEKDIISLVNSAYKKFGSKELGGSESTNSTIVNKFKTKVASDPVVKFIHENQRLPTEAELKGLSEIAAEVAEAAKSDQVLLYSSKTTEPVKTGNEMFDSMLNAEKGIGKGTETSAGQNTIGTKSATADKIFGATREGADEMKTLASSRTAESSSPTPFSSKRGNWRASPNPFSSDTSKQGLNASPSPRSSSSKSRSIPSPSPSPRSPSSKSKWSPSPSLGSRSSSPSPSSRSPSPKSTSSSPSSSPFSKAMSTSSSPKSTSSKVQSADLNNRPSPSSWATSPSPVSPSPKLVTPSPMSYSLSPISPSPSSGSKSSPSPSVKPSPYSSYSPSPSPSLSPYSPSPSSGYKPNLGSGGSGYRSSSPMILIFDKKAAKKAAEQRSNIRKAARARDKQLISKTKVLSFKETFGTAKKPRPSPFKSK